MADAVTVAGPEVLSASDFTGRLDLKQLRPGQQVFYELWCEDLADLKTVSAPMKGRFRTPERLGGLPSKPLRLVWGGDIAGQGYGISPEAGGYRIFDAMAERDPDVFVHCGDMMYADVPIPERVQLPEGGVWRNIVTEATSKAAETLDEFRGRYRYNFMDDHLRRFNAQVPQIITWDDHEITNDWHPCGEIWRSTAHYPTVRSMQLLRARARRALVEYTPLRWSAVDPERIYRVVPLGPLAEVFVLDNRSHRGRSTHNTQTVQGDYTQWLGAEQRRWLVQQLKASRATWKIISVGNPVGVVIRHGDTAFEGVANAEPGTPKGRELELAALLTEMKAAGVKNVVWLTADVHYAAAHHYDPSRGQGVDFEPFWEFVAGPLHAGTFGPNDLDPTFGPEVRFQKAAGAIKNLSPSAGLQFFGEVEIEPQSKVMTVTLRDREGASIWSITLPPV